MVSSDQKFFDIVAEEFRSHSLVDGIWVRSFSESGGSPDKARALYIQYRVEQLKAEETAKIREAAEMTQARIKQQQLELQESRQEARKKKSQELEASRQLPLDPKAKRILGIIIFLIMIILIFLLIAIKK